MAQTHTHGKDAWTSITSNWVFYNKKKRNRWIDKKKENDEERRVERPNRMNKRPNDEPTIQSIMYLNKRTFYQQWLLTRQRHFFFNFFFFRNVVVVRFSNHLSTIFLIVFRGSLMWCVRRENQHTIYIFYMENWGGGNHFENCYWAIEIVWKRKQKRTFKHSIHSPNGLTFIRYSCFKAHRAWYLVYGGAISTNSHLYNRHL